MVLKIRQKCLKFINLHNTFCNATHSSCNKHVVHIYKFQLLCLFVFWHVYRVLCISLFIYVTMDHYNISGKAIGSACQMVLGHMHQLM